MFYPVVKPHISPSALSAWHTSRSLFIRSYFMGEKSPETLSMKAGTTIHKLIELGAYPVQKRFDRNEEEVVISLETISKTGVEELGVKVLGKPDSFHILLPNTVEVVDYKTGKEDTWSNEKIALDLKCKMTAWLVLMQYRAEGFAPASVVHYVEYIPTEWNGSEIVPVEGKESVVYSATFTKEELDTFTDFILKTIQEVNEEYPKFLTSTDEFVKMEDVLELASIEENIKELEARADIVKERLGQQLALGNRKNFESSVGTVYITEKKTYKYPEDLKGKTENGKEVTLKEVEECTTAIKVAKKNYEQENEPESVSKTVAFRAKKK